MDKYITNFNTTSEFAEFSATTEFKIPHVTLTKDDGKVKYFYNKHNKHKYVDIGGVKWATMNVGATAVTDTGLYFQWGDTSGYTAAQVGSGSGQKYFGWADYKYGNGTSSPGDTGMTKYNSTDGKTVLDITDDAARANWRGQWRMPTTAEFQALGNAVNTAWTASYQGSGVRGLVCTDKTDSSKVLFFPAAGYCGDGSVRNVGSLGFYWSSSLVSSSMQSAYDVYFINGFVGWQSYYGRFNGFPVRGVVDGHAYVDLGLPSGTKWATMNVGALSETDYGNYYQYGKGANDYSVTSGQSNYSGTENPLATSADTASKAWGGDWHMPTQAQWQELTANTTYQWVDNFNGSGVNGGKFTAQNGNYIFLPASGNAWYPDSKDYGCYWSSTPTSSNNACRFYYRNGTLDAGYDTYDNGYFVRGVIG